MITEISKCPMCKSGNIKRQVWKPAGPVRPTAVRKMMEECGIGCIVEFICADCGFKHQER